MQGSPAAGTRYGSRGGGPAVWGQGGALPCGVFCYTPMNRKAQGLTPFLPPNVELSGDSAHRAGVRAGISGEHSSSETGSTGGSGGPVASAPAGPALPTAQSAALELTESPCLGAGPRAAEASRALKRHSHQSVRPPAETRTVLCVTAIMQPVPSAKWRSCLRRRNLTVQSVRAASRGV